MIGARLLNLMNLILGAALLLFGVQSTPDFENTTDGTEHDHMTGRNCSGYTNFIKVATTRTQHVTLGSPLTDGIFLVQKMCIYSCVILAMSTR